MIQPQALCTLKTIAEASGKTDQLSLNNMVFLTQKLFSLISLYHDFKGFGKLGVSSPKLGWDYNLLKDEWEQITLNEDQQLQIIKKLAKEAFSQVSIYDIGLVACLLFDEKFLGSEEKSKAISIQAQIQKKFCR